MNYKLWIEGESKGPCTLEDLRVMWEEGDIDDLTLYAEEGSEVYKPLAGLAGELLNITIPEEQSSPGAPPSAEEATAPAQNADAIPAEKTYTRPIPVLAIYIIGAITLATGVVLFLTRDQDSGVPDTGLDLSLLQMGVIALLGGYLGDLIAQCLYELKESNRWWRDR